MTNRLFITLDIPNDTVDEIIKLRDDLYSDISPRWESRDKLHITLKFLGDTDIVLIPKLERMLDKLSDDYNQIELAFNRFGIFYRNKQPKIFWLGAEKNNQLNDLQKSIDEYCELFNFESDKRSFHPHLTLLRIKGNENVRQLEKMKQTEITPLTFTAKTISLMKSELKPTGSVYSTIKSFELSKTEE
jgi:2'-5' RNA ligase